MAAPVKGFSITTAYGVKGSRWSKGYHTGADYACPVGTPVYAARNGIITPRNWGAAYGTHIVQKRTWPVGTRRHLLYAHLSRRVVKPGQRVKKGQLIGYTGDTGNTTGPHLHFEERTGPIWRTSSDVNPMPTILS